MKKLFFVLFFCNVFFASAQWGQLNSGTTSFLPHIFFLNEDTGYVSHDSGGMRRTLNGGASWTYINTGITIQDFHFFSVDTGVCISTNGIYRTVNGGFVWSPLITDASLIWVGNLFCLNNNNLYVTAGTMNMDSIVFFKSLNKGNTWSRTTFPGSGFTPAVFFTSADTGYISSDLSVYKTTDSGSTWLNTFDTTSTELDANYFLSNDVGFLLGAYTELLKSTDGGYSWVQQNTNGNNDVKHAMTFINSTTGYVVGGNGFPGFVLKTLDAGTNWTLDYASSETLYDVCFPSVNVGYACGVGGIILKYVGEVGIGDENIRASLIAYPNPTSGRFTLQTTVQLNYPTVSISNGLGDTIWESEVHNPEIEIDISNQPAGVYFVKLIEGERVAVTKIVKM